MMVAGALAGPLPDIETQCTPRSRLPVPRQVLWPAQSSRPTHSLVAVVVVVAVATWFFPIRWPEHQLLAEAFAAGYASHLVGDAISPMGQPYFRPLIWRRFRVPPPQLCIHSGTRTFNLPIALGLLFIGLMVHL
jgi:membrane-bound metal-dependent hydrolase YbcI (DUF457 family)